MLTELLEKIDRHFNQVELKDLCFRFQVDYESLGGEGKRDKARELITHMERRGRTAELIEACARLRPQVDWDSGPAPERQSATPAGNRSALERALTMARRTLSILEEQAAGYTNLTMPVHLKIELEEKRREVAELEARLKGGGS